MLRRRLAVVAFAAMLAGCQTAGLTLTPPSSVAYGPSADGTVGLVGNVIGKAIDPTDRRIGLDAEYQALETGDTGVAVEWHGRSGSAGVIVPGPRYTINDTDCRQFMETVIVGDTMESATATACRGADKVWHLVG